MAVAQRKDMKTLEAEGFFPKDDRKMSDPFDGEEEICRDALGNATRSAAGDNFDPRPVGVGTQLCFYAACSSAS
jgi:hypothetical protein